MNNKHGLVLICIGILIYSLLDYEILSICISLINLIFGLQLDIVFFSSFIFNLIVAMLAAIFIYAGATMIKND